MSEQRISDERLVRMRLATAFIQPLDAQDDIIAVIDDLRDCRKAIAQAERERDALKETLLAKYIGQTKP